MKPVFLLIAIIALSIFGAACSPAADQNHSVQADALPAATPSRAITAADVAKLKWIGGTWRGMDGDKPFYERYRLEGTRLVVETFEDGTLGKVTDTSRFELKDGQFGSGEGERRSAASMITDNMVQFVPAGTAPSNSFRFEKQPDGTWHATLEWPATKDKPASQKIYKMEPWKPQAN